MGPVTAPLGEGDRPAVLGRSGSVPLQYGATKITTEAVNST